MRHCGAGAACAEQENGIALNVGHLLSEALLEPPTCRCCGRSAVRRAARRVLTEPRALAAAERSVEQRDDLLLVGKCDVEAVEAEMFGISDDVGEHGRQQPPCDRRREADRMQQRPWARPSASCIAGVRDSWMPRPTRPARNPPAQVVGSPSPDVATENGVNSFLPGTGSACPKASASQKQLCTVWLIASTTLYERVNLLSRPGKEASGEEGSAAHGGKTDKRSERVEAGPSGSSEEHPGGRYGRVCSKWPLRGAHRRDRSQDQHVEADDLLLFRRQGGPIRKGVGGGVSRGSCR